MGATNKAKRIRTIKQKSTIPNVAIQLLLI